MGLTAFTTLLIFFSCNPLSLAQADPTVVRPLATPNASLSPSDQQRLREIQSAYESADYSKVIELAASFEKSFPTSPHSPKVFNFRGLALLLTRRAPEAVQAFQRALIQTPEALLGDRIWKAYVRYNFSAALLDAGKPKEASIELKSIDPDSLNIPTRLKYFQLKARAFEKQENFSEAFSSWSAMARHQEELGISEETIQTFVEQTLEKMVSRESLKELVAQNENTPFKDKIAFRSIQLLMEQGKTSQAREELKLFVKNYPLSQKRTEASELLRKIKPEISVGNRTIGLLLPLKGKFSGISQRMIQAATLALGIFGTTQEQGVTLALEDSGETPESAILALERLHAEHQVAAIIGPILSKGSEAVIQRAEELSLPMISMAQQSVKLGEFSFQGGITPATQTRELAKHAIEKMGIKTFAILAPRDRFGQEYTQFFWNAVEEFGGKVTAYETYESGETDFRKPVDRLAGLFYSDARRREWIALAEAREKDHIKKRNRKTERYFSLTPVVDFEAVFIPDEPKTASLAIPTFSYRDVDQIKILGVSAWNSPEFLQRWQKSAQELVFMDSFFPLATGLKSREFAQKFRVTFAHEASSLEALTYDTVTILSKVVSAESLDQHVNRNQVASQLREIRELDSVTGKISVIDGVWSRNLRPLTIQNSEIIDWTP